MERNKSNTKRYIVDAGKGKKLVSCPYSCYEDGRDITAYVIPPKGYVLTGFKLDSTDTDLFYDGRLIAIYEKATLWERMTSNPMITLTIFAVIIAIVLFFIFHKPKSATQPSTPPQNEVLSTIEDSISELSAITTEPRTTVLENESRNEQEAARTTIASPRSDTTKRPNTMAFHERVINIPKPKYLTDISGENSNSTESTMQKRNDGPNLNQNGNTMQQRDGSQTTSQNGSTMQQQNGNIAPVQNESTMQQPNVNQNQNQEYTLTSTDNDTQFKQEFWSMIHHRSGSMDAYTDLYNKYKGKVKGKEYDYLRGTILKDTPTFKSWYSSLRNIPASEIQGIETISDLKQKLN